MGRITAKSAAAALGIVVGIVVAAAAYGALLGYAGTLRSRHAVEEKRIRELREAVEKGVGGDLARAQIADLRRKIADDDRADVASAQSAATDRATRFAAIAFVATIPFLLGWIYRSRLTGERLGEIGQ